MEDRCRKEIENYLRTPKLDFEEDPLLWWKTASLKLSILSHKARKYLFVCATSSPSERVFSCSGNIVTPLRAHLQKESSVVQETLLLLYELTFRKSLQLFRKHCYSFTSSLSERVFSCSGNIVTPLQAHLQKESSVVQETLLLLYELTFRKTLQLFRKHCYSFTSSPSERVFSCSGNIVTPLRAHFQKESSVVQETLLLLYKLTFRKSLQLFRKHCYSFTSSPSERLFSCSGNIVTPLRAHLQKESSVVQETLLLLYELTFRKSLQLFRKHCYSFTSSPSERVFSCSGNIVTPLRAHLQKDSSVVQETLLLLYELTFRKSLQLFRKHCYSFTSSPSERVFSCSGNIVTPLRAHLQKESSVVQETLLLLYELTFRKSLQLFRKHCYSFTSSPSERVFSCSGNIVTPLRAHLQKDSSVVQETLLLLYKLTFRKTLQLFRKHCYSFTSSPSERVFSCSGNIVTPLQAHLQKESSVVQETLLLLYELTFRKSLQLFRKHCYSFTSSPSERVFSCSGNTVTPLQAHLQKDSSVVQETLLLLYELV